MSDEGDRTSDVVDKLDGKVNNHTRSMKNAGTAAKELTKAKKVLKMAFKVFGGEALIATAILGGFKLAMMGINLVGKAVHATMTGIGIAVGAAVAAMATFLAAQREMQVAQLSPIFGNKTKGIQGVGTEVGGILGQRSFGVFSDASLLQSIQDLGNAGVDADYKMDGLLKTLGDFATTGIGDPSKKLQTLVKVFADLNTSAKVTSTTFTALESASPELARAFGEFSGGKGNNAALLEAGRKAAESGNASSESFIAAIMGGDLKSLADYRGQLDRVNDTLIGRMKGTVKTVKGLLTDAGAPLAESLKQPLAEAEQSIRRFVSVITPTLQRVFPELGGSLGGMFDTVLDKLAQLVNRGLPQVLTLKDSLVGFARDVRDWWQDRLMPTLSRMAAGFDSVWNNIVGPVAKGAMDLLVFWLNDFIRVSEQVEDRTHGMQEGIKEIFEGAKALIKAFNDVRVAFSPVLTVFVQFVGILSSLLDRFKLLAQVIATLALSKMLMSVGTMFGAALGGKGKSAMTGTVAAETSLSTLASAATTAAAALTGLATGGRVLNSSAAVSNLYTGGKPGTAGAARQGFFGKLGDKKQGLSIGASVALMTAGAALQNSDNQKAKSLGNVATYAGTGAMIGTSIAPGFGTAVGAGLGAAVGYGTSAWSQREADRRRRKEEAQAARNDVSKKNFAGLDTNNLDQVKGRAASLFESDKATRSQFNALVAQQESIRKQLDSGTLFGKDYKKLEKQYKDLQKTLEGLAPQVQQNEQDWKEMDRTQSVLNANLNIANRLLGMNADELAEWAQSSGYDINKFVINSKTALMELMGWSDDFMENATISAQRWSEFFQSPLDKLQDQEEAYNQLQASAEQLFTNQGGSEGDVKTKIDDYLQAVLDFNTQEVASGNISATEATERLQRRFMSELFAPGGAFDMGGADEQTKTMAQSRINSVFGPGLTDYFGNVATRAGIDPNVAKDQVGTLYAGAIDIDKLNIDGISREETQAELNAWANGLKLPVKIDPQNFVGGVAVDSQGIGPNGQRLTGDTATSRFGRTMGLHNRVSGRLGGRQRITSGVRGFGLGSLGSDHLNGSAIDVTGDNLGAYAAGIKGMGGFAEFHGAGNGRHLHVVPGGGIGDSATPVAVGASAGGGAAVYSQTNHFTIEGGDDPRAVALEVKRILDEQFRQMRERE